MKKITEKSQVVAGRSNAKKSLAQSMASLSSRRPSEGTSASLGKATASKTASTKKASLKVPLLKDGLLAKPGSASGAVGVRTSSSFDGDSAREDIDGGALRSVSQSSLIGQAQIGQAQNGLKLMKGDGVSLKPFSASNASSSNMLGSKCLSGSPLGGAKMPDLSGEKSGEKGPHQLGLELGLDKTSASFSMSSAPVKGATQRGKAALAKAIGGRGGVKSLSGSHVLKSGVLKSGKSSSKESGVFVSVEQGSQAGEQGEGDISGETRRASFFGWTGLTSDRHKYSRFLGKKKIF